MENKYHDHIRERIFAWIGVVVVLLMIITAGFFGFIAIKEPVIAAYHKYFDKPQEQVQVEAVEAEPEVLEEEIISEETLDEIFENDNASASEDIDAIGEQLIENAIDEKAQQVEDIINSMTLEQKVAQLFFVTPEAITGVDTATAAGEMTREALTKYPVGGIVMLSKNIVDPDQISEMTSNMQTYMSENGALPLFIGVDEEGGSVLRIANNDAFDLEVPASMKEIGESADTNKAEEVGATIGTYLSDYGFNLDFAPVADILYSEDSVIGDRSFGSDPELVSNMSCAFYNGLSKAGVLGAIKHYPGHGSVTADSHENAVKLEKDWDTLLNEDIVPFKENIENGAAMIMAGHISVPEVSGDDTPASLSKVMINEKLRGELLYEGIVITDAMNMKAITDSYSTKEAAVMAINAGVDMILMPQSFEEAYEAVLAAAEDGTIQEDVLNKAVGRIVRVKIKL